MSKFDTMSNGDTVSALLHEKRAFPPPSDLGKINASYNRLDRHIKTSTRNKAAIIWEGEPVSVGGGYLALTSPWPAMLRGIYKDPERYKAQYWSKWKEDLYFTGDGAKRDEDGYFWLLGRVDDVINISGHRIGTMEVESALVDHPSVAEAAVVGISDEVKGQTIAAFVTLKEQTSLDSKMEDTLKQHVTNKIGAIARPAKILFSGDLPKTRSGKIMRRLLRDIAEGRVLGDTTTLADSTVLDSLKKKYEEETE